MFHGENSLIRGVKDVPQGCRERSWKPRMSGAREEVITDGKGEGSLLTDSDQT